MIITAIPAAIMPYSEAVAPDPSRRYRTIHDTNMPPAISVYSITVARAIDDLIAMLLRANLF